MVKSDKIVSFIKEIYNANPIMKDIFLYGSCYNLYHILKKVYPNAICYYSQKHGHAITNIDGLFYDITGMVKDTDSYDHIDSIWSYKYKTDEDGKNEDMYRSSNKTKYIEDKSNYITLN